MKLVRDTLRGSETITRNKSIGELKNILNEYSKLNGYKYSKFETIGNYLGYRVNNKGIDYIKIFYIMPEDE